LIKANFKQKDAALFEVHFCLRDQAAVMFQPISAPIQGL
jgi:hypothetical protein